VKSLPKFLNTTVTEINQRLEELRDEASRLEAALAALTGTPTSSRRPRVIGARPAQGRPTARANATGRKPPARRGGSTRATQALELVREQPGITIPELAKAMKIQPNYLYRVLPRLASDGQLKREGQGWHPAFSSNSTTVTPARATTRARRSTRTAKSTARNRARKLSSSDTSSATNGRGTRGSTTASVLAALNEGQAMTATEVATKAGLARPTVSTTLSKLAKRGQVQKAERGYRLASAA
jgi:DNA-binding MarR family transcriptional regulator